MISEEPVSLPTPDGPVLEGRFHGRPGAAAGVVVCHPHPLYGGDMDSAVVLQVVESCAREGLATLRFNFRGVGGSTGSHDGGEGEQRDLANALDHLAERLGGRGAIAASGYSFGAMVAAAVAASRPDLAGLLLVAPPLGRRPLADLRGITGPLLVIAGSEDEICPRAQLTALPRELPHAEIQVIDGTDHFFWGALAPVDEAVRTWARGLQARDATGSHRAH
jgi:alpha/beta superfamily hydrolase